MTNLLGQAHLHPEMTIHVIIGEVKTRLWELLNAMKHGTQIVIMRAGNIDRMMIAHAQLLDIKLVSADENVHNIL